MTAPGDQSRLREINDRAALALLLEHGELTRTRLCELTGLSRPTASRIMTRLESLGLAYVVGETSAGRGPHAASYSARTDHLLGVALNVEGNLIQATVVDVLGSDLPIVESALPRSAAERDPVTEVAGAVAAACAAAEMDAAAVRMICLGLPAAVDPRADVLSFVDRLPGWPRKGLHALLRESLGYDVVIDNDVNLAAIAERNLGSGQGAKSFALLWLGEGLGLAVDIEGTVLRGASGRAGEIDSLTVPRWAADLDPQANDLQALGGSAGLARVSRDFGVTKRGLTALLTALAQHPDRDAIFIAMAPRVAASVTTALAIVDPERVVLGGPIATCGGAHFARAVQAAIRRDTRWSPDIVASSIKDYPVLSGAREHLLAQVRDTFLDDVSPTLSPSIREQ